MSKTAINIFLFIAACVILFFMARNLIIEKKIPALNLDQIGEVATSTASSTIAQLLSDISTTTATTSAETATTSTDMATTSTQNIFPNLLTKQILTSKGSVETFVADTEASREQGLSDIPSLPDGVGMLFVFPNPGNYGFWMKDMHFPLDLIWIDDYKNIVGVTKNALPVSYPFVFMPPRPVEYVIEMNAGSVARFGLTTGTKVSF